MTLRSNRFLDVGDELARAFGGRQRIWKGIARRAVGAALVRGRPQGGHLLGGGGWRRNQPGRARQTIRKRQYFMDSISLRNRFLVFGEPTGTVARLSRNVEPRNCGRIFSPEFRLGYRALALPGISPKTALGKDVRQFPAEPLSSSSLPHTTRVGMVKAPSASPDADDRPAPSAASSAAWRSTFIALHELDRQPVRVAAR